MRKPHLGKIRLFTNNAIMFDINSAIKELDQNEAYRYLGIREVDVIKHLANKDKFRKEFYRRMNAMLHTKFNTSDRFMVINSLPIPIVTYCFNIIDWMK